MMGLCWPAATSPTSKLVLMALADVSNDEGFCQPQVATLARYACLAPERVQQVLADLKEQGLVREVMLVGEAWLQLRCAAIAALAAPAQLDAGG